jgi:hypothetical protein
MERTFAGLAASIMALATPISAHAQNPVGVVYRGEDVIVLMDRPARPPAGFGIRVYPRPAPDGEVGRYYDVSVFVTCEDGTAGTDGNNSLISAGGSYVRQYDVPLSEALSGVEWPTLRSILIGVICRGRSQPTYRPQGDDDLLKRVGTEFQRGTLP